MVKVVSWEQQDISENNKQAGPASFHFLVKGIPAFRVSILVLYRQKQCRNMFINPSHQIIENLPVFVAH